MQHQLLACYLLPNAAISEIKEDTPATPQMGGGGMPGMM